MNKANLQRVFRYNSVELEDPGPDHDPVDVRNLYSATYPEITSAAIEGPEQKDGKLVYTFRRAVGTKGVAEDPAGFPKFLPTVLERIAIQALNEVKAWRDSDGNEGFPEHTRTLVDAALMTYEQRRSDRGIDPSAKAGTLTFEEFRAANVTRCVKWHPAGINSWSPSDWLTALAGELGELASLLKMRNRERDGLPGNKFSPTDKQVADELADVLTYLDLLAAALGVDLGRAAAEKFNEVSERVGFPDRIRLETEK